MSYVYGVTSSNFEFFEPYDAIHAAAMGTKTEDSFVTIFAKRDDADPDDNFVSPIKAIDVKVVKTLKNTVLGFEYV